MNSGKWFRRLLILLFLLPLILVAFTPLGQRWGPAPLIFLIIAILNLILLVWLFRRAAVSPVEPVLSRPRMIHPLEQPEVIREVMDVCIATEENGIQIFRGPLRDTPERVFAILKTHFQGNTLPLLQQDDRLEVSIMLVPSAEHLIAQKPTKPALHWLLFFLTFLTTTWAGAMYQDVNLIKEPARFVEGLPYAFGLMAILAFHEFGHYFAGRHHKMDVTPPFFIPVPFALGTFGAFIRMRKPPEGRTSLFDMAIAGPLAGLVIAIPALLIGLRHSELITLPVLNEGMMLPSLISDSFLFGLIARIAFPGEILPSDVIRMSPLAFAGWLGLLITALNLMPIGQLDGGHIARAMFGTRKGSDLSRLTLWALFLLVIFKWPQFWLWLLLVFFVAARNVTPPMNDLTPVNGGRRWLGYFTFVILAMIIVPLPAGFWEKLSIFFPWI